MGVAGQVARRDHLRRAGRLRKGRERHQVQVRLGVAGGVERGVLGDERNGLFVKVKVGRAAKGANGRGQLDAGEQSEAAVVERPPAVLVLELAVPEGVFVLGLPGIPVADKERVVNLGAGQWLLFVGGEEQVAAWRSDGGGDERDLAGRQSLGLGAGQGALEAVN